MMIRRHVAVVSAGGWMLVAASSFGVAGQAGLPVRPTGSLEIVSGPTECAGQTCYEVRVTCPEVASPARALVKVASPEGMGERGTILFTTGGAGMTLYEATGRGAEILERARTAGFRTVQLQWLDGWLFASEGAREGHARLACRPATVARWVHEHLAATEAEQPFCATGHSGGAAQTSYMLSHYGLEEILDGVVPTGGPPSARMDLSCDRANPAHAEVAYPDWAANVVDAGFGYLPEGNLSELSTFFQEGAGPCALGDQSFLPALREASVASGLGDYVHPHTMVSFVFEGIDDTRAVAQGMQYVHELQNAGSPMVKVAVVPGVTHAFQTGMYAAESGARQVTDALLDACRIWR